MLCRNKANKFKYIYYWPNGRFLYIVHIQITSCFHLWRKKDVMIFWYFIILYYIFFFSCISMHIAFKLCSIEQCTLCYISYRSMRTLRTCSSCWSWWEVESCWRRSSGRSFSRRGRQVRFSKLWQGPFIISILKGQVHLIILYTCAYMSDWK